LSRFSDVWAKWFPQTPAKDQREQGGEQAKERTGALPPLLSAATGRNLLILALAGVLLMLLSKGGGDGGELGTSSRKDPTSASGTETAAVLPVAAGSQVLETRLAGELERLLSQVAGAGRVEVYITMESGPRQVLAEEVTTEKSTGTGNGANGTGSLLRESRRPLTVRDEAARSEKPVVLVQIEPEIRGVLVLADGAGDAALRYTLAKAVATILGVDIHKVSVLSRYN